MSTLSASLDTGSLDELASALEGYADGVGPMAADGALALGEVAARVARDACPSDTGELRGSIAVTPTVTGCQVTCTSDHAAYVEFGTGAGTPSSSPFDADAMSGQYEVNATGRGDEGWAYPTDDGGFAWTHGQSGRGFMATGAEAARSDEYEVMLRYVRGIR